MGVDQKFVNETLLFLVRTCIHLFLALNVKSFTVISTYLLSIDVIAQSFKFASKAFGTSIGKNAKTTSVE